MKCTQLILTNEQRVAIEATWEATTNLSIPQYVERIKEQLVAIAESDLRYARKAEHLVAQTQHGTLTLSYNPVEKVYRIACTGGTLWLGSKAGAVSTLVNAYRVEA